MRLLKSPLLLIVILLVIAACSPSSPSPTAPPTSAATAEPSATPTPLIAATIEVTAAATPEATSAATEAESTRDSTAEATAESTANAQLYLIREPLPGPACSISPTGGQGVNVRREPSKDAEAIGGLLRGAWALATGLDESGVWFQISAPGTPVDGGWITSRNVAIRGVCNCAPGGTCEAGAPLPTATR